MSAPAPDPSPLEAARAHLAQGRLAEAEAGFRALIAADPNNAQAIEGMGEAAMERGAFAAAHEFLDIALAIDPSLAGARVLLGMALMQLGQAGKARAAFEQAIADGPSHPMGHYWLGHLQMQAGQMDAGLASLDRALGLWPDLVSRMSVSQFTRLQQCDWAGWTQMRDLLEKTALEGRGLSDPLTMMMMSQSAAAIAACARVYAATHYPPLPPRRPAALPRKARIKLGIVSTDFHDHPVAHLLVGVLESFDRDRFDLTAYALGQRRDPGISERIAAAFDRFHAVHEQAEHETAALIAADEIDIAVTLNGYTTNARPGIFTSRPAPVQVSFQGYPGTMGAPYIDYLIADRHVIPAGEERFYTEQVVRMPHTYQPTDNKADIAPRAPTRAEEGLPDGAFVFMGYNAHHKISPITFDVWMRILRRVPGSVLWLQGRKAPAMENLRREAAQRGVDPERLRFAGLARARGDHIARHALADLFLDTLPYNAHSTASDALWGGVPIVTCCGTAFPGRVCAGLLTSAGLPELIVDTLADYENLAVALASDRMRLEALKTRVRNDVPKSPLFDTQGFASDLGRAFAEMYERSQAGLAPQAFDVADLG